MMDNYPINEALDNMEDSFEIDLVNKVTGATYANAPVMTVNTMAQIMQEYAADIGINPNKKVQFVNKRTGQETAEKDCTVEALGLKAGDVLSVCDDGNVA